VRRWQLRKLIGHGHGVLVFSRRDCVQSLPSRHILERQ
jgi:hypothetical protein